MKTHRSKAPARTKALVVVGCAAVFVLSGCADTVTPDQIEAMKPVGFWHGLWHGMILPFAWLVSLFNSDVAIYATYNNGGWYDFGFILGVGALSGGSSSTSQK